MIKMLLPFKKTEDTPEQPLWLVTFTDLVSLLLTFFVMLYAMKVLDEGRWQDVQQGLTKPHVTMTEEAPSPQDSTVLQPIVPLLADNLDYLHNLLQGRFAHDAILQHVEFIRDAAEDRLIISLPSAFLFKNHESALQEEGQRAVMVLADQLRHLDNRLVVAGYTDPLALLNSPYPSNWELAMARAVNVATLMKQQGIDETIRTLSYADSRFYQLPETMNDEERYGKARRVDVIIYGDKGKDTDF